MYLCGSYCSTLKKDTISQLALNNHLFCGKLPVEFEDLTWAEEMACALYHTSAAHVSCL
ncbi:hypothetical protein GYMLUDRAFT_170211 [Collybiopsis luxurians FD-317 M1]|uniref:DUF6570 domain-containing protein n=1 Tax=Collybiopsis luxurians FD-317 M1 TaxID=944289 RepID=A0A0D0CTK7_9AGAR|nr:hypothetical protein GYMLUDRAFT_170211 [Collybiopsis luxurians FD-317 M1]